MAKTLEEIIAYLCDGDRKNKHLRKLITLEALMEWYAP